MQILPTLPHTPELLDIARRVVWFEPPAQTVANPHKMLSYAMTYGTLDDWIILFEYVTKDDLRLVLDNAPAGVIDARSWAYWNLVVGRYPAPPMPERKFDD